MRVELIGDPGLEATFDVTPDIAHNRPLTESEPGLYRGEYTFPVEIVGGPFTVIGRLRHDQAGETVVRDPASITIPIEPRP